MQIIAPTVSSKSGCRDTVNFPKCAEAKDFCTIVTDCSIVQRAVNSKDENSDVLCNDIWKHLKDPNDAGGHHENTQDSGSCEIIEKRSHNRH